MEGLHKRVGEVRHQDKPITIEVLHELDWILEAKWQQAKLPSLKQQAAKMGTWFIVGFCSGLRGEECYISNSLGLLVTSSFWLMLFVPILYLLSLDGPKEIN
jgi:hypothetical protein